MNCAACQHENPDGSAFCEECGARFARRCPACGSDCAPTGKFCRSCGTALAPAPAGVADTPVARKVITIVFADLIGSTSLHERLDPESVSRVMERYHTAVRGPVEAHGGTVVNLLGDGVMCAFGVPHVAEDDAIRAVRAAVGIQHAFREFAREHREVVGNTGLRVAVNTGEVVVSDDYAAGIGDPLNVAARLQQEAHDGDVLIGQSTQRLVRDVVTLEPFGVVSLKGRAETVTAYRVVSLERPAGASATPFVGRDDEMRRIMAVYDAAVAARRARLAVILGSPGLGKSRLVDEVARRLGENVEVLRAQCDAAGGATFAPIAKALRAGLRVDEGASGDALRAAIESVAPGEEAERPRIAAGIASLLAGAPAPPEETFFVIRRQLAALAAKQPVVLIIDDLHWAEPLLLDLTEHLVQWSTDVPLLVLAAARPELRETRSSLTSAGGLVSDVVTLAGLEATAATRLAANVIGAEELPAAIAGRVLAASEGNPLFVGELVRMLVQDGALKRDGDRWTTAVELADVEMPPTIQALLAARIERLRPEERTVLERAAVVGRQFSRAALTHLLPREITDLDTRLEALRRSELVEPDVGWFLGEPALRFHHVLIRDAAYRRILKGTRAELHARLADWLEGRAGEAVEHDQTIGWHLEQAHQHLRELGPIDEKGKLLGERASTHLAAAGRRALARDDVPLAASLLGRAIERLDAEDSARAELALDWCEALLAAGDVGPAAKAIAELGRFAGVTDRTDRSDWSDPSDAQAARLRAWHTCFAGQLAVLTEPQALRITANAVAAAAVELAAAGDLPGEAKAHSVHALALARLGEVGACEAALDRALAAARRGHDRRRANAVLAEAPLAALWGPSPVTRASGRCLDVVRVLRITQGAPGVEAVALRCQAVLEALRGRAEAARRMVASSRRMVEELGITQGLLETEMFAGLIELIEGDTSAAEQSLRTAYEGLRDHGLGIDAARAAALLGRTLLAQGRPAEAETLSHESEALAGDDLQAAITWRRVRAEALARRGEHAAAVDFARAAVDIAAATDALLHHADARLALATALRAAGRSTEAAAEQARAIELWEAKGANVLAERARRGVGLAQPVQFAPAERDEPAGPAPRRVRANTATAHVTRLFAAIAARDLNALTTLIADEMEAVHHPTHSVYDGRELLRIWRATVEARDGTLTYDVLATLGDSLALCRQWISASGAAGEKFDFGAYEIETIALVEVDAQGRRRRSEIFAADRLGDAIARLYERHADLLPEGPERARAAATARSVAAVPAADFGSWAATLAPDIQFVDRRGVGFGSVHGAEAVRRSLRAMLELVDNWTQRFDDILALRPDAFLVRWTNSGTARVGGGAYERPLLLLRIFGPDGRVTYIEQFEAEQDAEALARFDELILSPSKDLSPDEGLVGQGTIDSSESSLGERGTEVVRRRVRPNAATANAARGEDAIARRDIAAFTTIFADDSVTIDHPTGTEYGVEGALTTFRSLLKADDPTYRIQPLASLGDSLALWRQAVSASGLTGAKFDVGAYERDDIVLIEVDADGRRRWTEWFATDRLGDAVVRLYERYAELLPAGGARTRAAATARSVAALLGPLVPERWEAALAPDVEYVDHRTLGLGSSRGAQRFLQGIRTLLEVAAEFSSRVDDILGLHPDALVVRRTISGTVRASGGAFEQHYFWLVVVGSDGLLTRAELFDADRDAGAMARFDELTAAIRATSLPPTRPARRVRPNAATANAARFEAAIAARDVDAVAAHLADSGEVIDHNLRTTFERQGSWATWRSLMKAQDGTYRLEPLAALGDSLALCRQWASASGMANETLDVGAYEFEHILLVEVDPQGRRRLTELFAADRLGDAIVRLYERHAELLPEGPARARAATTARAVGAHVGPLSIERFAAAFAPDVELHDHRSMGLGSLPGKEALLDALRSLLEVAADAANRVDDVFRLQSDALLICITNFGTQRVGEGAYERPFLLLFIFGADGLVTRLEQFDIGREGEAVARFEQFMRATVARRLRTNAATANLARANAAFAARDAEMLPSLLADRVAIVDHTTGATYDRWGLLATQRFLLSAADSTYRHEPLATLGDSLALARSSTSASGFVGGTFDVGPYEREEIVLIEVDAQGRRRLTEIFAADRLADALARLYERYAELLADSPSAEGIGPQAGPERGRAAATARSVAAMLNRYRDPDCYATGLAPAVEFVDHQPLGLGSARGAEVLRRGLRALLDLSDDTALRVDDVLGLRSDAVLVRETNFGTDRASGGAYERHHLSLCVYGADGLLTRLEWFAADRDADALARFDELAATGSLPLEKGGEEGFDAASFDQIPLTPPFPKGEARPARRVRANAATVNAARWDAAITARDADALLPLLTDDVEAVHHPTGTTYGQEGALAYARAFLRAKDVTFLHEPLATLGDSLALCHRSASASGIAGRKFDVGAYENEVVVLIEVDAQGQRRRFEVFATTRLGDAVARLYERYADLLPDGPTRARAAATARSVAAILALDSRRLEPLFASDIEFVDHRSLGLGSARGAKAALRRNRALLELADNLTFRIDDILGLRSDMVLWRATLSGTDRTSGGPFEHVHLHLRVFGADGLQTRLEFFDPDRDAEALARFDELAREQAINRAVRRVRPNAATANAARFEAAFAARDADAIAAHVAFGEAIEHDTGAIYEQRAMVPTWLSLMNAQDGTYRTEPLATLGDTLALSRQWASASGVAGEKFDVGAYEVEHILLIEVDAQGQHWRTEIFALNRLADAITRLYERYADLLPGGPVRARAAATARSVAAWLGRFDPDRYATAFAPAIESIDHRTLGTWSARGAEPLLQHFRSLLEVADNVAMREDDILSLRPDAFLLRRTNFGTDRAGGGTYERQFLWLGLFGSDGLLTRSEVFDSDRDAEALARFDELVGSPVEGLAAEVEPTTTPPAQPARRVRANAATANTARLDAAIAARDADALPPLLADCVQIVDHPTGVVYDREGVLFSLRSMLRARDVSFRHQPLAVLGDSLALFRQFLSASGAAGAKFDVGAYESERIVLIEVDNCGRRTLGEFFNPERLGDSVSRLYERYAELLPEGLARTRAAATARSVAAYDGPFDPGRYATAYAPDMEAIDHRILGTWSARGAQAFLDHYRSWLDLADDIAFDDDDVLALESGALLWRRTFSGIHRAGGGAFERQFIQLWTFGAAGLITRIEYFDTDRDAEALARFDELVSSSAEGLRSAPQAAHFENAATRFGERIAAAWTARDWERVAALHGRGFRRIDRRAMVRLELDRDAHLEFQRLLFEMSRSRVELVWVATRGNRLALNRFRFDGADGSTGPTVIEELVVSEVDDHGEAVALIIFDPDDLDAAYAELDERYVTGEAAPFAAVTTGARAFAAAVAARDWGALAAVLAPDLAVYDHRPLGWETLRGPAMLVDTWKSLVELAPDARVRIDHVTVSASGSLAVLTLLGTHEGGEFEDLRVVVHEYDGSGRIRRHDIYNVDQLDEARARFAAIDRPPPGNAEEDHSPEPDVARDPLRIPPNAATRMCVRHRQAFEARDWSAIDALCGPTLEFDDRRRGILLTGDRDMFIAGERLMGKSRTRLASTVLATAGDRLALERNRWTGPDDAVDFEAENLSLTEVDADGRIVAVISFDPDERRAAAIEMLERYSRTFTVAYFEGQRAVNAHDVETVRALLSDDFVLIDHRRTGLGRLNGEDYLASLTALFEQAPDVTAENLYTVAVEPHGILVVTRNFGTLREGGDFESVYVRIGLMRGDRIVRVEMFEPEHFDLARARFEELRAEAAP